MIRSTKLFRILTYVLLPVTGFFGLMGLLMLLPALANPGLLLIVFMLACMVIYNFSSIQFLQKAIDGGRRCKPSLRDWIKVNGYVSLAAGGMFFLNAASILFMGPVALQDFVGQALERQPGLPANMDPAFFIRLLKTVSVAILLIGAALVTHVIICFRLLKQYKAYFNAE